MIVARRRTHAPIDRIVHQRFRDVMEGRLDAGNLHLLPLAGLLPMMNRRQNGDCVRHSSHDVRMRAVVDGIGGRVGVVAKCAITRDAIHRPTHRDALCIGTRHPIAGTAQHDEVGPQLRKHVIADSHLLRHARHHVSHDDMRNGDEAFEELDALFSGQIEGHAQLVPIGLYICGIDVVGSRAGLLVWIEDRQGFGNVDGAPSMIETLNRLDLDDFRAEIAEPHTGHRTGPTLGEFEHPDSGEGKLRRLRQR